MIGLFSCRSRKYVIEVREEIVASFDAVVGVVL